MIGFHFGGASILDCVLCSPGPDESPGSCKNTITKQQGGLAKMMVRIHSRFPEHLNKKTCNKNNRDMKKPDLKGNERNNMGKERDASKFPAPGCTQIHVKQVEVSQKDFQVEFFLFRSGDCIGGAVLGTLLHRWRKNDI